MVGQSIGVLRRAASDSIIGWERGCSIDTRNEMAPGRSRIEGQLLIGRSIFRRMRHLAPVHLAKRPWMRNIAVRRARPIRVISGGKAVPLSSRFSDKAPLLQTRPAMLWLSRPLSRRAYPAADGRAV